MNMNMNIVETFLQILTLEEYEYINDPYPRLDGPEHNQPKNFIVSGTGVNFSLNPNGSDSNEPDPSKPTNPPLLTRPCTRLPSTHIHI